MYGINDLYLESLRAATLASLLLYLLVPARNSLFANLTGARQIVTGFALLLLATLFDISDEVPGLERFLVIGATEVETYLETLCYIAAFVFFFVGFVRIIPSIARLDEVGRELRESEARFRLIFESSPDPLIIARTDGGGIVEVNRAFVAETGIARDDAIGKTSAELNLWANSDQREEFLEQLRRAGEVSNFEGHFRRKNGEVRICLASAQLIRLGELPCMLLDTRDITSEKQIEAVLVEMDRMKSEFISMAAHELRTPLTTMLGYAELLRDVDGFGDFSAEQRAEFLDEIYQKGKTLSRIIDDMLDISRIETGQQVAVDRLPHDPLELLEKVVRRFEMQSPKHCFQREFPGEQPPVLPCDLHRLTQVLDNLLSNAVKYSPRGGTITVAGQMRGNEYVVTVADQGIGMSPEQQLRVFDKFYRADSSNTAIGGLGLGMSIARQIVEAHGGRIWVESVAGEGTTVSFSLPLTV